MKRTAEELVARKYTPENLASGWEEKLKQCDYWLTFAWHTNTRMPLERALSEVRTFLRVRFGGRCVVNGVRVKDYGAFEALLVAAPYPTNPKRPHVHVALRHVAGEVCSAKDIPVQWGVWCKWKAPEACVVATDVNCREKVLYMLKHSGGRSDYMTYGHADQPARVKERQISTVGSDEVVEKGIVEGVRRLLWLAE